MGPKDDKKDPKSSVDENDQQRLEVADRIIVPSESSSSASSDEEEEDEQLNAERNGENGENGDGGNDGYELLPSEPGISAVVDYDEEQDQAEAENENSFELGDWIPNRFLPSSTDQQQLPTVGFGHSSITSQFQEALATSTSVHLKDTDFDYTPTVAAAKQQSTTTSTSFEGSSLSEAKPHHQASSKQQQMGKDKIEEIKRCMANVSLPPTAQPNWAKHIPDSQWKSHLLQKLKPPSSS